jgi:deazaflavin-dependent oxidoreductase (nitroreductase family)
MRRYSPERGRSLTPYEQLVERGAATRAGGWLFVHVLFAIDRRLLAATRGRVSCAPGTPVGLLETTGARSGARRRTPLLYVLDGDAVVLVASNIGRARHPGWLHNLRADPAIRFLTREHGWRALRAREASGDERARLWDRVADVYAGYRTYQRRAGARRIPIVVLEPELRPPG